MSHVFVRTGLVILSATPKIGSDPATTALLAPGSHLDSWLDFLAPLFPVLEIVAPVVVALVYGLLLVLLVPRVGRGLVRVALGLPLRERRRGPSPDVLDDLADGHAAAVASDQAGER